MPDMLVRLYDLPDLSDLVTRLRGEGIEIPPVLPPEQHIVLEWVRREFGNGWASECARGINNTPVSSLVAIRAGRILGFACYDATCRGFFGPTGVTPACRGLGIGKALLWETLRLMREVGYGYAVIGGAGPTEFYTKTVGAIPIPGSVPGIYRGLVNEQALEPEAKP